MNTFLTNIWNHPKTSIAGVLICATTIAGVLSQQGITLGHAGTGTVVALIASIAAAFLGLVAKDPSSGGTGGAATGAMIAFLCIMLVVGPVGCTQQQKITVAQEIVNWTPVFISTADTVNASVEALDPPTAVVLVPLTAAINAFGPELQKAAQAYLANPNQTTLQVLQALVVQIQQDANTALLAAAKITNPTSQAMATRDINLIATIANTLLGLVQSISSKAQVAAMSARVQVQLALVRPYMDRNAMQAASLKVSRDLALNHTLTVDQFFNYEAKAGF
jgi:hypothetical protein